MIRMRGSREFRIAVGLCILGVLFLQITLAFSTSDRLFLWQNEHHVTLTRSDAPLVFRITPVATLAVGLLSLAIGLALFFKPRRADSQTSVSAYQDPTPFKPGLIWRAVNILLILYSPITGYSMMSPTSLERTNPGAVYCAAILFIMPLFVLGTLAVSRVDEFRKPSWDRFPLRLWSDPLQFFFIGTWASLGIVLGSLLRLHGSGSVGFWTLLSHCSIFLGLIVGQALGYWLYRNRITGPE
jgi:hypothetical protein